MEVGTPLKPLNAPPKVADAPADGARTIVIRKSRGLGLHRLPEVWEFRELLFFIAWRDVKIRYKQTFFGAAWAVIQPLALMLVFWLFAGKLLHSPSILMTRSLDTQITSAKVRSVRWKYTTETMRMQIVERIDAARTFGSGAGAPRSVQRTPPITATIGLSA